MTNKNVHPEGLPVEPEGQGWTLPEQAKGMRTGQPLLLNDHNIHSIRNKEPLAFEAASFALKQSGIVLAGKDPRSGRMTRGWTDIEIDKLAALAVFVAKGVVEPEREPAS